jgi:hypothetical protein
MGSFSGDSVRREEKIMPFLDVTDVLLDPDFVDLSLVCYRQVQTVDEDNFPTNTAQAIPFSGVVTVDRSLEAKRMAAGQNINGAILIVTQFRLTQGCLPVTQRQNSTLISFYTAADGTA